MNCEGRCRRNDDKICQLMAVAVFCFSDNNTTKKKGKKEMGIHHCVVLGSSNGGGGDGHIADNLCVNCKRNAECTLYVHTYLYTYTCNAYTDSAKMNGENIVHTHTTSIIIK